MASADTAYFRESHRQNGIVRSQLLPHTPSHTFVNTKFTHTWWEGLVLHKEARVLCLAYDTVTPQGRLRRMHHLRGDWGVGGRHSV